MRVIFNYHGNGLFTGTPADEDEREAIVQDMIANGAIMEPGEEPYYALTEERMAADLESLGVASIFGVDGLMGAELDVDEWTFRRLCGYSVG